MTKASDHITPRPVPPDRSEVQPQPPADQRQDQPLRQIGATQEAARDEAQED